MNVWHSSSSESKPCVVCGKKTAHYKVYEQSHITISVPLCDWQTDTEKRKCYYEVDIKKQAANALKQLKQEVLSSAKGVEV